MIWVWATGTLVLCCSWAKHFALTVSLFSHLLCRKCCSNLFLGGEPKVERGAMSEKWDSCSKTVQHNDQARVWNERLEFLTISHTCVGQPVPWLSICVIELSLKHLCCCSFRVLPFDIFRARKKTLSYFSPDLTHWQEPRQGAHQLYSTCFKFWILNLTLSQTVFDANLTNRQSSQKLTVLVWECDHE